MDNTIEFFIPGDPKAIQSVRFAVRGGFVRTYQPKGNVKWKSDLKVDALAQLPDDFKPIEGPLKFQVIYLYAPLSSMSKKKKKYLEEGNLIMKPTRPDLQDNLSKGVCDAMTGILWKDDSQIVASEGYKAYSHKGPGILIRVTPLAEEQDQDNFPDWVVNFLNKEGAFYDAGTEE